MDIRTTITSEDFNTMRASVGWKPFSRRQSELALAQSMAIVGIYESNAIVAMGRLVGDGACKAMLTDIIVRPEYQGKGYGRAVLESLKAQASSFIEPGENIFLQGNATTGKLDFYIRCGFHYEPEYQDGISLWIRK